MFFINNVHIFAYNVADSAFVAQMNNIDVSLLTCQPHEEVYSLYGHTAIRLNNKNNGEDLAVNYGVFDTRVNFFVLRFVFGLTDYSVGVCRYSDFLDEYRYYGSKVYEQRLNMSPKEKMAFIGALMENLKPENATYRYNFFYNNCTTQARDILFNSLDGEVKYDALTELQKGDMTYRQLLHNKTNAYRWVTMGNDMLLGVGADASANHEERQFLPEVLMADVDSASVVYPDGRVKKLVDSAFVALPSGTTMKGIQDVPFTPTQAVWTFLCAILALVVIEAKIVKKTLPWVHYFIYCMYASAGIILFLMIFSQHPTVRVNLQILILNPLFFYLALPKVFEKWGKYIILMCLLLFFAGNIIQDYAEGMNVMALSLLLTFCPYYLGKSKKNSTFAS